MKNPRIKIPELDKLRKNIDEGEDAISIYLKAGWIGDAKKLKDQLKEARYEVEMMELTMNMDFSKPKPGALEDAKKQGLDLTDPLVIAEFERIQVEKIDELRRKHNPELKSKE